IHGVRIANLLGTHVGRRAEDLAVVGHSVLTNVAQGQAEVHDSWPLTRPAWPARRWTRLGCWVDLQHDIRWLDIAMDDSLAMRIVQGVRDLGHDLRRFVEIWPPTPQAFFQTYTPH